MGAARNISVVSGGTFVCPAETILYICQAAKFLRDERGGQRVQTKGSSRCTNSGFQIFTCLPDISPLFEGRKRERGCPQDNPFLIKSCIL